MDDGVVSIKRYLTLSNLRREFLFIFPGLKILDYRLSLEYKPSRRLIHLRPSTGYINEQRQLQHHTGLRCASQE